MPNLQRVRNVFTFTSERKGISQALSSGTSTPESSIPADESATKAALKGVRLRAMSAAGPSGARPEHLRELVAVRDRRVANTILAAISKFVSAAMAGELADAARWILDSRLVFLGKKKL